MKQTITLNRTDIELIIAKYFHIEKSCVNLRIVPVYSGYGLGRNKDIEIEVQIVTTKEI